MTDEREGVESPRKTAEPPGEVQTSGREANAAQPLSAAPDDGGPERYPATDRTDALQRSGSHQDSGGERRSFDPSADAPTPRQGAGDGSPKGAARTGPAGDPAEGRR